MYLCNSFGTSKVCFASVLVVGLDFFGFAVVVCAVVVAFDSLFVFVVSLLLVVAFLDADSLLEDFFNLDFAAPIVIVVSTQQSVPGAPLTHAWHFGGIPNSHPPLSAWDQCAFVVQTADSTPFRWACWSVVRHSTLRVSSIQQHVRVLNIRRNETKRNSFFNNSILCFVTSIGLCLIGYFFCVAAFRSQALVVLCSACHRL